MTWSYSGDPASSPTDEVRFLLGDTNTSRQLVTNEEITYEIARLADLYDSTLMVAASLADALSARFATEVSQSGDGVSIGANELQQKYTQLGVDLRDQYNRFVGVGALPYVGSNDTSYDPLERPGWASIGQHDNIEAGRQDTSEAAVPYPDPGWGW